MNIKKVLMSAAVAAAGIVCAQEMTLVAAREKIVESIANPATMTATISQLSAEDQKQLLADVNAAIGSMPGRSYAKASARTCSTGPPIRPSPTLTRSTSR